MTRSASLRSLAVTTLKDDEDVQARLGDDGGVLVVDQILGDEPDESDPRLFVDAETSESNRSNKQEHKRFNLYLGADATSRYVRRNGDNALANLLDAAADVMTTHPGDRWFVDGIVDEQNDGYVDDIGRYRRFVQIAVERRDIHPAQADD